jgi:hypothetical protein
MTICVVYCEGTRTVAVSGADIALSSMTAEAPDHFLPWFAVHPTLVLDPLYFKAPFQFTPLLNLLFLFICYMGRVAQSV